MSVIIEKLRANRFARVAGTVVGGLIVLDDHWWPSVRTAAHYFETNMGWRVVPGALDAGTIDLETGRPRLRGFRLPNPPFEPSFEAFQPF